MGTTNEKLRNYILLEMILAYTYLEKKAKLSSLF